jgi:hypothetical protein
MIISPTFGWKKVSGKCCLIISGGIVRLITKTHTSLTCCFGIDFAILKFGMQIGLESGLI